MQFYYFQIHLITALSGAKQIKCWLIEYFSLIQHFPNCSMEYYLFFFFLAKLFLKKPQWFFL